MRPARRRVRISLLAVACALLVGSSLILLLRQLSVAWSPVVSLVAFTPYVALSAGVALLLAAVCRSRLGALVATAVVLLAAAVQLPLVVPSPAGGGGAPVVVMTANLKFGMGDASTIVAEVRDNGVDILALEELTPEAVSALKAAGLETVLPYPFAEPRPTAGGTGLWSRWPLTTQRELAGYAFAQVAAEVTLPGGTELRVAAVHILAPTPAPAQFWARELSQVASDIPASDSPILMAGDFNATVDHAQFRGLLATGYSDAVDQSGGGPLRTFPSGLLVPALVDLDHVLSAGGVGCVSTTTLYTPGSDHRALVARCTMPAPSH